MRKQDSGKVEVDRRKELTNINKSSRSSFAELFGFIGKGNFNNTRMWSGWDDDLHSMASDEFSPDRLITENNLDPIKEVITNDYDS